MKIKTIQELEKWCEGKTVDEIIEFISYDGIKLKLWRKLKGKWSENKAEILYNKVNNKQMDLKITKEKIIEAANKCSTVKETLKTLFPEVFEEEKSYKRGQRFIIESFTNKRILSQTNNNEMCLICLKEGNRFNDPIKVKNVFEVTHKEVEQMAGGRKVTPVK